MRDLRSEDIESVQNARLEELERVFGNIYPKLMLLIDKEKKRLSKKNVHTIVNETEIVDYVICFMLENIFNEQISNKPAYFKRTLIFTYYKKLQQNMDPNHELFYDDAYKQRMNELKLHEVGEIELTDKQITENTNIIRRIKRKHKAFHQPKNSGKEKAQRIESKRHYMIDRPEIRKAIKEGIKSLTPNQRNIFLRNIKRETQRELANELGVSDAHIAQTLKVAREKFSIKMSSIGLEKEDLKDFER